MNRKKIIHEIMGKELEKLGFEYEKGNVLFWPYVRNKDGVIQEITVCEERFCKNHTKMYFSTNAYGQKPRELMDFVPGVQQGSWKYETEEEFRRIMEQFKEWTFTYGLELLEKISVPTTEERPKPETNRYLYEHHEELNKEYLKKMGLEGADAIDIVFGLEDEIKKLEEKPFEEVEEILRGLAAVFGHNMCLLGIGRWNWDEERQICNVINTGDSGVEIYPLSRIIGFYKYTKMKDFFINEYMLIIYRRNTKIRAGKRTGELIDAEKVREIIERKKKERQS